MLDGCVRASGAALSFFSPVLTDVLLKNITRLTLIRSNTLSLSVSFFYLVLVSFVFFKKCNLLIQSYLSHPFLNITHPELPSSAIT